MQIIGCVRTSWCGSIFDMASARIGIVGDFQPHFDPHSAIVPAVEHAQCADASSLPVALEWIATNVAEDMSSEDLANYHGWWIAPGSPYRSMAGALKVIRHAREHDVPLLGTCGGYQHVVLEYARNVLGFTDAAHAEYDPYSSDLFITAMSCFLVGQTMTVKVRESTTAARFYKQCTVAEKYYCNFGLNLDHLPALTAAGLVVSGTDQDGEPRVLELPHLRFFVATLFVPQTSSTPDKPHPLIIGLLRSI